MPYKNVKQRRTAQSKWVRANTKGFYIRLSLKSDQDIIEALANKENKQGYVKSLIRRDIDMEKQIKNLEESFEIKIDQGGKDV